MTTDPAPTDEQVEISILRAVLEHHEIVSDSDDESGVPFRYCMECDETGPDDGEWVCSPLAALASIAAALSSARATNAALHESLNVTAERAARDRRALDEAQAKVAAVEALCDQWKRGLIRSEFAKDIRAALAAAQPTEQKEP